MKYQFISAHTGQYPMKVMFESLGIKPSGYYDWLGRAPSEREKQDGILKEHISSLHQQSNGRYGYRPMYGHLPDIGIHCGRDRTLRLMQELGLEGVQEKGFKAQCTDSNHNFGYSPNLLACMGKPTACDQVWVADTTYLKTDTAWCYLATVMDLYSRRILGWSVSSRNDSALVCRALEAAVSTRGGQMPAGICHHSDRGSTYACGKYSQLLEKYSMKPSMSRKGNCYENAAMESFYGKYKQSSVRGRKFANETEARSNAFEYIEVFYNRFRKHSSLGYKSPVQFEAMASQNQSASQPMQPASITNN